MVNNLAPFVIHATQWTVKMDTAQDILSGVSTMLLWILFTVVLLLSLFFSPSH